MTTLDIDIEPDPETGPLRRCLVTRRQGRREEMLRFVVAPTGELLFDVTATLPGRGYWLSAEAGVLDQAIRRGVFPRAAKAALKLPADLGALVRGVLTRRIAELLGLARRGGAVVSGFEKAREWLTQNRAGLVVQACDGSAQERARFLGRAEVPVVTPLGAAALGQVLGREQAVHVVVAPGRLARMIEVEARRLQGVAVNETSGQ
ncbi:RNA-binding protein [Acidocella sp.]|uniref:RNA-binding protein n=1 Tax=Acidocella sp. TaxID=50710 RepID=UPI002602E3D3|nr:RNA-binding protein [Acidocella sp.]